MGNSTNLTPKQENFCLAYLETGNASEAYRRAYDSDNMKPESINRKAKDVIDNVKIKARLSELRAPIVKANKLTVLDLIRELEEARQAALTAETPQSAAAATATMGKAKLLGFDKQVVENIVNGSFDVNHSGNVNHRVELDFSDIVSESASES